MPSRPMIYVSVGDERLRPVVVSILGKFPPSAGEWETIDRPDPRRSAALDEFRAKIAACDLVIHVVGKHFGPGPDDPGPGNEHRSFAQLEYDVAVASAKPLYIALCADEFPTLELALPESDELLALQNHHRKAVTAGPGPVTTVRDEEELQAFVWDVVHRWRQLHSEPASATEGPGSYPDALPGDFAEPPGVLLAAATPGNDPPQQKFPTENVIFTAYRPGMIRVGRWEKLLVFAHLDEKPDWLDEDERTPLEEMEAQAASILGRKLDQYSRHSGDSRFPVPRDGEITLAPEMAGVEFDPPRRSFFWREGVAVHGETFRLRASAVPDAGIARGRLTIFFGTLILAEIGLAIRVGSPVLGEPASVGNRRTSATPFRKIFASYSHRDVEVVETLERHARTLGDEYLRDWMHLRSGEQWDARLLALIEQADVFQLFWSRNSAGSPFVTREWQHALRLGREAFVRPTYWELPMPPPPADLARIHFHLLTPTVPRPEPVGAESIPPAIATLRSQPARKDETACIALPTACVQPIPPQPPARMAPASIPMSASSMERASGPNRRPRRFWFLLVLVGIIVLLICCYLLIRQGH